MLQFRERLSFNASAVRPVKCDAPRLPRDAWADGGDAAKMHSSSASNAFVHTSPTCDLTHPAVTPSNRTSRKLLNSLRKEHDT